MSDPIADPAGSRTPTPPMTPEVARQVEALRTRIHETFGKVALAMMGLPRYRHLPLSELQSIVLEPLMCDRVVIAARRPASDDEAVAVPTGIAIWASVSETVDAGIQEQIRAGVFPVRLQPADWTSGSINWLLEVIAPNQQLAASVIGSFKQVVKQGDLRVHPMVTRLVDREMLIKMGARPVTGDDKSDPARSQST